MVCEKCGKEIDGSYGSGRFCSRQCSNTRIFGEESNRKKSEAIKNNYIKNGSWNGLVPIMTEEQRKKEGEKRREFFKNELMGETFDTLSFMRKRKRVILEQENKCFECGLGEWRGKKLTLEIEHKNGTHSDNSRENLIAICPNCHSLTLTWRGRNKSKDSRWLSGPEIYELSKQGKNIRQILLIMGFAAKGANYIKVRRILERFENIPLT